nr:hypothetical protein [Tanacetum cinerariifolium]
MDLFAFINHADPTKVRIGEKQIEKGQVMLLESTRGRVVSLAGVNEQGDANIQDVGHDVVIEEGAVDGQENPIDADIVRREDEVPATIDDKPKGTRKKRKTASGANGSVLPPKRLREDHDTSGDAGASTVGKSLITYVPKWNVINDSALDDPEVTTIEAAKTDRLNELIGLKEWYSALEEEKNVKKKVAVFESVDAAKETELTRGVYPRFLTTIAGRRWIINRGFRLVVMKCLQSPEYLGALEKSIGRAIDKGPAAETLETSQLQPSYKQLMLHIHQMEDNVVIGETSLSFSLDVVHAHVQRIKEMTPSTSGVPIAVAVASTLSTTFAQTGFVPPMPVSAHDAEPHVEVPFFVAIIFEKEELETTRELRGRSFPSRSLSLYAPLPSASVTSYGPSHLGPSFSLFLAWLASLFRYTRSPGLKLVLRNLELYYLFIFSLLLASRIAACSLLSSKISRLIPKASSFYTMSISDVLKVGMLISVGITVFILYVSENAYHLDLRRTALAFYFSAGSVSSMRYCIMPDSFAMPASEPYMQDDPSVNNVHGSGSSSSAFVVVTRESSSGRSTMKSAKICPFTDVISMY